MKGKIFVGSKMQQGYLADSYNLLTQGEYLLWYDCKGFNEGLKALAHASFSVKQALGLNCMCGCCPDRRADEEKFLETVTVDEVIDLLHGNVEYSENHHMRNCPTFVDNGPFDRVYTTGGGIEFGFFLEPGEDRNIVEDYTWSFHLSCPRGHGLKRTSSLIDSALDAGFDLYIDKDPQPYWREVLWITQDGSILESTTDMSGNEVPNLTKVEFNTLEDEFYFCQNRIACGGKCSYSNHCTLAECSNRGGIGRNAYYRVSTGDEILVCEY